MLATPFHASHAFMCTCGALMSNLLQLLHTIMITWPAMGMNCLVRQHRNGVPSIPMPSVYSGGGAEHKKRPGHGIDYLVL